MRGSSQDGSNEGQESDLVCPLCGALVPDWSQLCDKCGRRVRPKEEAARAERGHIAYLLKQIPWLQRRSIVPDDVASRLQSEFDGRTAALNRIISPPLPVARPAAPVVPPLPTDARPSVSAADAAVSAGRSEPFTFDRPLGQFDTPQETRRAEDISHVLHGLGSRQPRPAPSRSTSPKRPARQPRPQASPEDLRLFFQAHGLKLIFALATMLVVYALKNLIAWQTVGDIAIRLVPLILIGLTFMFAQFGSRTRDENPWAAYAFHALACVLVAFDIGSINRFWLEPIHLGLPHKPALLLACALGTALAGLFLSRSRQIPYLHLVQAGILTTLFSLLQALRLAAWHDRDFRATPLALFGAAYLVVAAVNFWRAALAGRATEIQPGASSVGVPSTSPGNRLAGPINDPAPWPAAAPRGYPPPDANANTDTLLLGAVLSPEVGGAAVAQLATAPTPEQWRAAWTLWANLSAAMVVVLSALNGLLSEHIRPYDLAPVLLLAGIVYAAGAQALRQRSAVFTSAALFLGSALLWLAGAYSALWNHFGFLVMGIAAGAMALAAYNDHLAREAGNGAEGSSSISGPEDEGPGSSPAIAARIRSEAGEGDGLAQAWRRVARVGLVLAASLIALQVLGQWRQPGSAGLSLADALTHAVQGMVSGVLLLLLGRQDARAEYDYGAAAMWATALVGLLEAFHAPLGAYAVAFTTYGAVLYTTAIVLRRVGFVELGADERRAQTGSESRVRGRAAGATVYIEAGGADDGTEAAERRGAVWGNRTDSNTNAAWLSPNALARSGLIAATLGALGAAALPTTGMPAQWLWSSLALAIGCAVYVLTAREERSLPAAYSALGCLAYATALVLWRIDGHLSPSDLLAPFAVGTGLASLLLALRPAAQAPIGAAASAGQNSGDAGAAGEERIATDGNHHGEADAGANFGAPVWAAGDKPLPYGLTGHSSDAAGDEPLPYGLAAPAAWASIWPQPLAVSSLTAALLGLFLVSGALLSVNRADHPIVSLLPMMAAAVFVMAGRRRDGKDGLRSAAASVAGLSCVMLGAFVGGLAGGPDRWTFVAVERAACLWIGMAWMFQLCGTAFGKRPGLSAWSGDLTRCGLVIGMTAALADSLAAMSAQSILNVWPTTAILVGCFLLMAAEVLRTGSRGAWTLSAVAIALSGAAHSRGIAPDSWFPLTAWSLFAVTAAASYFWLARKERSERPAYATLWPLLFGFALFFVWKCQAVGGGLTGRFAASDVMIGNYLWMAAGGTAGLLYLRIAKILKKPTFAYLSASIVTGACCHALLFLTHPGPERLAVTLVPFLAGLYAYGVWRAGEEPFIGDAFRNVALATATGAASLLTLRSAAGLAEVTAGSQIVLGGVIVGVFGLMTMETYRTGRHAPRILSMLLIGMGAVCFHVHLTRATPFPATLWTLFALVAAASCFLIARHEKEPPLTILAMWPLALSYTLFAYWKTGALLAPADTSLANGLVALGGLGASFAYFDTAREGRERVFSTLSAILLLGTYCHALTLIPHITPEWFTLALLPMILGQYGLGLYLRGDRSYLGDPLREVGIAAAFAASLVLTVRASTGMSLGHPAAIASGGLVIAAAFALSAAETFLRKTTATRVLSFVALVLYGMVFQSHIGSAPPWIASIWTVAMLAACAAYFAIAWREENVMHAYAPLAPLLLGYGLYNAWRSASLLASTDNHVADFLWVAGVAGAAFAYVSTARRSKAQAFAYLGATLLVGSYTHLLSILDPHEHHLERYALLVLPLLAGMYAYGVVRQADPYAGLPFRRVALALSGLAVLCSTFYGDGFITGIGHSVDHAFITWTLCAYGLAYSAIAVYRRTQGTVASASLTLTAGYLHGLFALTYWTTPAALSWPRFAVFVALAAVLWTVVAWLIVRRFAAPEIAKPLQGIAAGLALLAAVAGFANAVLPGEGDWSLAALIGAGAVWIGLWRQDLPEACWHVGAWNLLAAWAIAIHLHFGGGIERADLTLIPFGLYLLLAGHRSAERDQMQHARMAWWAGLIVTLGPCFVLYWTRAAGMHHIVLLLGECVAASLWGVVLRIRAYVSAGFAFLVLLMVASWFRHVNDIASTVSALAIGVTLFICVYYWLTHRERIETWLLRASGAWRAWSTWR